MSSVETEYNTPEWLSKLILSFFSEGIALDPASNPDSAIPASIKYGRQSDGTFVDALKLPAWVVDSAVKTCYLNPPGGKIDGNVSVQGAFIDKLLGQIGNGERVLLCVIERSQKKLNPDEQTTTTRAQATLTRRWSSFPSASRRNGSRNCLQGFLWPFSPMESSSSFDGSPESTRQAFEQRWRPSR